MQIFRAKQNPRPVTEGRKVDKLAQSYPSNTIDASKNAPTSSTKSCSFPALQLHDIRRQLVESLTLDTHGDDPRVALIVAIDRLRCQHQEATNCCCWFEVLTPEMQGALEHL